MLFLQEPLGTPLAVTMVCHSALKTWITTSIPLAVHSVSRGRGGTLAVTTPTLMENITMEQQITSLKVLIGNPGKARVILFLKQR